MGFHEYFHSSNTETVNWLIKILTAHSTDILNILNTGNA